MLIKSIRFKGTCCPSFLLLAKYHKSVTSIDQIIFTPLLSMVNALMPAGTCLPPPDMPYPAQEKTNKTNRNIQNLTRMVLTITR